MLFINENNEKNKRVIGKILKKRGKQVQDLNEEKINTKNGDKNLDYDLTSSIIADMVIEVIKNTNDTSNLTIDNNKLIYYDKTHYENKEKTKSRIESIIQVIMDKAKIEVKDVFIKEIVNTIKRRIYSEMESFEKIKKNIELDGDKNLEYIPHSNDGIIFGNFDEIIGYEKAKKEVMEDLTFWIKYPDEYKKRGLKRHIGSIFYGIGGTGKTVTALAFKDELTKKGFSVEYVYVKTQELSSGQVSESSRKISDFFINLRRSEKPILVLMDEIDFLCKKRNDQALSTERTTEFLRQLGGFDNSKIYIIGTTNKPNTIDDAMLRTGRFSRKYLFDVPSFEERKEFVEKYLMNKDLNIEMKTSEEDMIEIIAKRTNYLTGSDFNQILEDCINLMMRKKESEEADIITINELHNIISENAPRRNIVVDVKGLRNWGKKVQFKLSNYE